ncbi:hypothetical protein IT575_10045 [bacterium]|nr:hypothetical protein [bacterium]
MLCSKYVESGLFLSSSNGMRSFVRDTCRLGLQNERWPIRTAYLAAYTCSRTFDAPALEEIALLLARESSFLQGSLSWWESFCADYVMVAARLDDPQVLRPYFANPDYRGTITAVRTASLAHYLGMPELLAESIERIKADPQPSFRWEAENATALYRLLRRRSPDLPALCRQLKHAQPEHMQYCTLDLNLLLRLMHPGLRTEAA